MSNGTNISATVVINPVSSDPYGLFLAALGPVNPAYEGKYEDGQTALWRNIGPNGTLGANWKAMNQFEIDPENAAFLGGAPATCSWGPGRMDMFVADQGGSLWHIWASDAPSEATAHWGTWEYLGSPLIAGSPPKVTSIGSTLSVLSFTTNELAVWFRGTDNNLWGIAWGNGWTPYYTFPIPGGLSLATAPSGVNTTVGGEVSGWVFVVGNDANLWCFEGDAWHGLGAPPNLELDVNSAPCGMRINATSAGATVKGVGVVARASDGTLWCRLYVPSPQDGEAETTLNRTGGAYTLYTAPAKIGPSEWQPWMPLNADITGSPVAVAGSSAFMDVMALGSENNLIHTWLEFKNPNSNGGIYFEFVWSAVASVASPQPLIAPPCAVVHGTGIAVLMVTETGGVQKITLQSASNADSGWSVVPANAGFAVQT